MIYQEVLPGSQFSTAHPLLKMETACTSLQAPGLAAVPADIVCEPLLVGRIFVASIGELNDSAVRTR